MLLIDPDGLFNGDRLRHCSNSAQLHWPRIFLASDGFGRLEINYARIIGRAYPTFEPIPSETELQSWIREYSENFLLFLYRADGRVWGQWDVPRSGLLPRFKTSVDRRSPNPPEKELSEWKRRYRNENTRFPKCFGNSSEEFPRAVAVAVAIAEKHICASGDARVSGSLPSIDNPPFETTERDALFPVNGAATPLSPKPAKNLTSHQERWFREWWPLYWRHTAKKAARESFRKQVQTEERFARVMAATHAQLPEMISRPVDKRPYPATWLNGERWEDEAESAEPIAIAHNEYPELPDED